MSSTVLWRQPKHYKSWGFESTDFKTSEQEEHARRPSEDLDLDQGALRKKSNKKRFNMSNVKTLLSKRNLLEGRLNTTPGSMSIE